MIDKKIYGTSAAGQAKYTADKLEELFAQLEERLNSGLIDIEDLKVKVSKNELDIKKVLDGTK